MKLVKKLTILGLMLLVLTACGTNQEETRQLLREYDQFLFDSNELAEKMLIQRIAWEFLTEEEVMKKPNELSREYYKLSKNKQTAKYHKLLGLFNVSQMNIYKTSYDIQVNGLNEESERWLKIHVDSLQKAIEELKAERLNLERKLK